MDPNTTLRLLDPPRFDATWRRLGAVHCDVMDELVERYAEPHRAYHTAEHIQNCLRWLDAARHLADRPDEIEAALYFHDVIYAPWAGNGERRSAALALERALDAGVDPAVARRLAALVEVTIDHRASDGDAALVCDIDLAILGSAPARYARYAEQIRGEHSTVDEETYRRARAQALRSFLDRLAIYATPFFSSRLEAQARTNLARELRKLEVDDHV